MLAFHVNPQRPRSLSSTGEDMFVRLARAAEEAGLAPDRVVAVFDFDLTISDHHSGGTDVALAEDGRVDCGIGRPCFTDQAAVRADLSSVARRLRKLVILSRGRAQHLAAMFRLWEWDQVDEHPITYPRGPGLR